MAIMQALLQIKADVTGDGKIAGLGKALGGLEATAGKATGGLRGMLSAAGGLSGVLGTLAPVVSGVGLAAMAKGAIDAADDMNDLAQKTGVSVERLSQFKQAAEASGTSIEGVGGALIKLNRNMATENKGATEALTKLGISATDASGRLKSADEIMLEVADKFSKMPDGAEKSAAAMALFGKSGADMIPMLNGGRAAVEDLSVTMTTKFAKGADQLNDKMVELQTQLTVLAVELGTALMPALNIVADAVVGLAEGFSKMPRWMQGMIVAAGALVVAIGPLVQVIGAIITASKALAALKIGATIAGWAGAIGPAIGGITAAFSGLLAWLSGTLLPGLLAFFSGPVGWTVLAVAAVVAMAIAFRKPIMDFVSWLWTQGEPIRQFWSNLWDTISGLFATSARAVYQVLFAGLIQPWLNVWNTLKEPVEVLWGAVQAAFKWGATAAYAVLWQLLIQPWINVWSSLRGPVEALWGIVQQLFSSAAAAAYAAVDSLLIRPWLAVWDSLRAPVAALIGWVQTAWAGLGDGFQAYVATPITALWTAVTTSITSGMQAAASFVNGIWTGLVNGLSGLARSFVSTWVGAINGVVSAVNRLISGFNALPGPDVSLIPTLSAPAFAEGGVVNRPTMALVGEGGEPEYIIPQSKMAAASASYLSGVRGAAVLNGASGTSSGTAAPVINITTGPVMQAEGQDWVTVGDLQRAVRQATNQIYAQLRTPAGKRALGVA